MSGIDWVILGIYFTIVLGVGAALRRFTRTSTDFFLAGRALPAWVCGLAFISANLGAQEVIGMAASGAKYGVATGHFYWVKHVQIFENRGAAMGASNPHPHCQIWANATVPDLPSREQAAQTEYRSEHGVCLLCACLAIERTRAERIVYANRSFTALVPFWAVWPFEMLVIPNRHVAAIDEFTDEERTGLADILKQIVARYDALFDAPCPYSMGFHQRPADGEPHPEWHLHAHYYSPVLRSAAVHKFMVGYELLATPQRDLTPEAAAAILRERAVVNSGA